MWSTARQSGLSLAVVTVSVEHGPPVWSVPGSYHGQCGARPPSLVCPWQLSRSVWSTARQSGLSLAVVTVSVEHGPPVWSVPGSCHGQCGARPASLVCPWQLSRSVWSTAPQSGLSLAVVTVSVEHGPPVWSVPGSCHGQCGARPPSLVCPWQLSRSVWSTARQSGLYHCCTTQGVCWQISLLYYSGRMLAGLTAVLLKPYVDRSHYCTTQGVFLQFSLLYYSGRMLAGLTAELLKAYVDSSHCCTIQGVFLQFSLLYYSGRMLAGLTAELLKAYVDSSHYCTTQGVC